MEIRFAYRRWLALACLLALELTANPAAGADHSFASGPRQVTVIELFTSQGCSSCPPAEAWLGRLLDDPRLWREIVPVAFHVDYWDRLGWPDVWAERAHSARQRRYRDDGNISAVYTPGVVVNGREFRWTRSTPLGAGNEVGELWIRVQHRDVIAEYEPIVERSGPLLLNLLILASGVTDEIRAGENRGRTLTQDFVVLSHRQALSNDGRWRTELPAYRTPPRARLALAAWISGIEDQAPLQATGGWLSAQ